MLGYGAIINAAYLAALLLRFEGVVPARHWAGYTRGVAGLPVLRWPATTSLASFHSLWRYASTVTLFQIVRRDAVGDRG